MEKLTAGRPAAGDERELRELWRAVFGDGDEVLDAFFSLLYRSERCALVRRRGVVASAGYCLPGPVAGDLRASYIYAVATLPEHRSAGAAGAVVRRLCAEGFASGADIVATLPASESLCRWYERLLGMAPAFRAGCAGFEFPESWREYAAVCGEGDGEAPDRLLAVARPGVALPELGWELTLQ